MYFTRYITLTIVHLRGGKKNFTISLVTIKEFQNTLVIPSCVTKIEIQVTFYFAYELIKITSYSIPNSSPQHCQIASTPLLYCGSKVIISNRGNNYCKPNQEFGRTRRA